MEELWYAELLKDEIRQKQKKREYHVLFSISCLNKLVNKVMGEFNQDSIHTGYEKGKKTGSSGKYNYGKYDLAEIEEVMQQTVIEIFQAKLVNDMITIDEKTFPDPVKDGLSLFKCIKYFLKRRISKSNDLIYKNVPGIGVDTDGEEFSRFDIAAENRWLADGNDFEKEYSMSDKYDLDKTNTLEEEIWKEETKLEKRESRLLVYADILKWIQRNDVHKLFRSDAVAIQAVIDVILGERDLFKKEYYGGKRFVTHNELQDLLINKTGEFVEETNITNILRKIEQRLLQNSLYALNYEIGEAPKSKGETDHDKESERFLWELEKKSYKKLFGRESMCIYDICNMYRNKMFSNVEVFLTLIRHYENVVCPILERQNTRKKYDMVNLLTGNIDIVVQNYLCNIGTSCVYNADIDRILEKVPKSVIEDAIFSVVPDLVNTVMEYYYQIEYDCVKRLLDNDAVEISCSENDYALWEVTINDRNLNIRFFKNKEVKRPVVHRIDIDQIMVFEGYRNLYFCDKKNMNCYCVNKNNRVVTKSDYKHNIFFERVA